MVGLNEARLFVILGKPSTTHKHTCIKKKNTHTHPSFLEVPNKLQERLSSVHAALSNLHPSGNVKSPSRPFSHQTPASNVPSIHPPFAFWLHKQILEVCLLSANSSPCPCSSTTNRSRRPEQPSVNGSCCFPACSVFSEA